MTLLRSLLLWVVLALPALALDPSEMLDDPALEARARALDHELRCVVCQSEALASSNADWAREARRTSRELIAEGRTDDEVRAFFVERYGEFVLMNPPAQGSNLLLWAAGPMMLLIAAGVGWTYLRGRNSASAAVDPGLSSDEQARLREILKD